MSFIDNIEPIAEWFFPLIGNAEIYDALSNSSNFSAPEPNYVS